MKKICVLITLALILCLSACSKSKESQTQNKWGNNSSGEQSSTTQTEGASDTVVVPNVVGMNKDEAVKKLERLGLIVETTKSHYKKNPTTQDFYPDNYVIQHIFWQ